MIGVGKDSDIGFWIQVSYFKDTFKTYSYLVTNFKETLSLKLRNSLLTAWSWSEKIKFFIKAKSIDIISCNRKHLKVRKKTHDQEEIDLIEES